MQLICIYQIVSGLELRYAKIYIRHYPIEGCVEILSKLKSEEVTEKIKDVETLLKVFHTLIGHGTTVIVIEHDLDVIRNADYIIDMGPGGGEDGGRIIACGRPEEVKQCKDSITARFL